MARDRADGIGNEDKDITDELDYNVHRIGNWCDCGHCQPMPTGRESCCCLEVDLIEYQVEEAGLGYITENSCFVVNCLNRDVVMVSVLEFAATNGPLDDNQPSHKLYRYVAYRRFVRWIWQRLPRTFWKILPSCVVYSIRTSETYCGFKYALPN